jgi:hypothetical protein
MRRVVRDMYDLVEPPERGAELRRLNKERLARLEAEGPERRARIARARKHRERHDA